MPWTAQNRMVTFLVLASLALLALGVLAVAAFAKFGMRVESAMTAGAFLLGFKQFLSLLQTEITRRQTLAGQEEVKETVVHAADAAADAAKQAAVKTRTDVRHDVRNELQATVLATALAGHKPHECWQTVRAAVLEACPDLSNDRADALCDKILDLLDRRAADMKPDDAGPNPPNPDC